MSENIAIKVEGLTKIYPIYNNKHERMKEALSLTRRKYHKDFHALDNVSFEIKKGETIGIIGQNGSGKSTLLKILTGVLSPTSGNVQVDGKVSALLELGAGFNPEMTGMENIYLNGTIMGYTREEMSERIPKIVEFADIGEFIEQPVKMYSSGMFARLAFAVAINVEPEILIVDEALSVGDMRFQIKCMSHMKKMMEGGTTVLFVSHDTNAIRRLCSKCMWINSGKIIDTGECNKVCDEYMGFLKLGDVENAKDERCSMEKTVKADFTENENIDAIAEIMKVEILNEYNGTVDRVEYNERIKIRIVYQVYDEGIYNPVLGVALRSIDETYLCGVNTCIEKNVIPWNKGINQFYIEYPEGLRVLGGGYYFDIALFEETAMIPIHYMSHAKHIEIKPDYQGEGVFIIPHVWKDSYEQV